MMDFTRDTSRWRPTRKDFLRAIEISKDTSPGPDGLPFCAWRAIKHLGAKVLCDCFDRMVLPDGLDLVDRELPGFNDSVMIFLAKKVPAAKRVVKWVEMSSG